MQALAAFVVLVYSFVLAYVIGLIIQKTIGFRVTNEDEVAGSRHRRSRRRGLRARDRVTRATATEPGGAGRWERPTAPFVVPSPRPCRRRPTMMDGVAVQGVGSGGRPADRSLDLHPDRRMRKPPLPVEPERERRPQDDGDSDADEHPADRVGDPVRAEIACD